MTDPRTAIERLDDLERRVSELESWPTELGDMFTKRFAEATLPYEFPGTPGASGSASAGGDPESPGHAAGTPHGVE